MCILPQLQDAGGVHGRVHPAYKVEVPDVQAAVCAHGQGHRGQQLVAVSQAVAAGAGDAAPAAVPHDAGDDRRLLGHKDVLATALVEDAWRRMRTVGNPQYSQDFSPSLSLSPLEVKIEAVIYLFSWPANGAALGFFQ